MTAPSWNALLLSVGTYQHYPALRSAAVDARELEAVLADPDIGGFAKIDRLENPAAEQARRAVADFLVRHGDSAMLIYFSGHGKYDFATGRLHLLMADSPRCPEDAGDSVTDVWLMSELAMASGEGIFVVLDTCFGGAALSQAALSQAREAPQALKPLKPLKEVPYALAFRPMMQGHGYHTLAAASPVEPAGVAPSGLSHLTHALVEVLRDGSAVDETGWASVGQLCDVVAKRVVDSGCGQTPMSSAHQHGRELYLARRPPAEPSLAAVRQALANRDYPTVRRLLRPVKDSDNGEYRYYAVLATFGGHRPREFATDDIKRAEGYLSRAGNRLPQLCALWALIKEDHYLQRGIDQGTPTVEELIQSAREIEPWHAAEIVTHLPAPECQTWVRLRNRAQSNGV
ncbi:MAG TPA: caspase family protein [Candidatus Limnocylindrales bacterium]|nr:caspase family protein [Candidatus Limnocylindrales bacterium]